MEMVAARERFLAAGHFQPIADGIIEAISDLDVDGPVVDIGSGPGWYLARVLEAMPDRAGLALDNSKFAARKAAKCHPRAGAVVADIWDELPVLTGSAAAANRAFADKNSARACPTSLLSISANTCPRLTLSPTPATRREMRPGTSGPTTAK